MRRGRGGATTRAGPAATAGRARPHTGPGWPGPTRRHTALYICVRAADAPLASQPAALQVCERRPAPRLSPYSRRNYLYRFNSTY